MTKGIYRALTVAGSDSGGGAGIQADLKTFMAHGVYGCSAITAVTAQNTLGVNGVVIISPEMVAAQMDAVLSDIGCDAVKTGMLGNAEVMRAVAESIKSYSVAKLVVDPVMISTSGHRLSDQDTADAYINELFPLALLATPNLFEAEVFYGQPINTESRLADAARNILGFGPRWVLIKGGHRNFATGKNMVTDLLTDGISFVEINNPRLETRCTHGTGCTLSAAITAGLARGMELPEAVRAAETYLHNAIKTAVPLGKGHGPVNHGAVGYKL
ncbi:MAG: phosphomethylpyrimidine kinase [Peptococcaceae bacterium BRH_c4a]|nr:MAG: phosphomethylpyrimidine kinase [Peptococcaceae bacterium BRH_c4a]